MKQLWNKLDFSEYVDEFNSLYASRPIRDNRGGMTSAHMFPCWYLLKKLQPKTIIESGVWKGQGTWLFEKALPKANIICIDPSLERIEYRSPNAQYQSHDFLDTDWSYIDKDNTLCFFDDHQNALDRLKKCKDLGFKHLIFEDNYPITQGDCYSPKKILANQNYAIDKSGKKIWYLAEPSNLGFFHENVEIYQEMPPLFTDPYTRWGDLWQPPIYETPEPILSPEQQNQYSMFYSERHNYTWLCYIRLR